MAYDGLYIRAQVRYYKDNLINERIFKITQNNPKEFDFHIKKNHIDYILTLSCDPNFPYMLLSSNKKENLPVPPSFCMLLRKYLQGGEFMDIKQINGKDDSDTLERIVDFSIKNIDESGNNAIYHLIIELMGRYSNILLLDNNYTIIDLVNKINSDETSERKLIPGKKYETIAISKKNELINIAFDDFIKILDKKHAENILNNENDDVVNNISECFLGISKSYLYNKKDLDIKRIYNDILDDINMIDNGKYKSYIFYLDNKIKDFHVTRLTQYDKNIQYENTELCLYEYYKDKLIKNSENINKKLYLEKINKLIEKYNKKIDINEKDLKKSENFEIYKTYGDLILSYGFDKNNIKDEKLICKNYYDDNKEIIIPIDMSISIERNSKKYYDKYNKLKRTQVKVVDLYKENTEKLEHLLSIKDSIILSENRDDLEDIKDEINTYFIHNDNKNNKIKKNKHIFIKKFVTSNNIDVYVGKNNIQNEYLTFKFADKNDTWLHVKGATGAHVILKANYETCDIKDIEEAASIAGYYSSKSNENKVEVDYTLVKELKKVKGKMPGFCIYHKNYSIVIKPSASLP